MTLQEFYDAVGGNANEMIGRMGGSEAMVAKFLHMFADDPSYGKMQDAIAAGDAEEAFHAAHTLKGVCMNLGLARLHEATAELVEIYRAGTFDGSEELLQEVEAEYQNVCEGLEKIR